MSSRLPPSPSAYVRVDGLNLRLADAFGRSPASFGSQPRIAWKWSADLTYKAQTGVRRGQMRKIGSLLIPGSDEPVYDTFHQLELDFLGGFDRWLLCEWQQPNPPAIWYCNTNGQIAYPDKGLYVLNNTFWCRKGETPDEDLTNRVIHLIRESRALTGLQKDEVIADKHSAIDKAAKTRLSDFIDQHVQDHLPGVRGNHYLAFNANQNGEPADAR